MDKFINKQTDELCDISKIYSNIPYQNISEINKTKQIINFSYIKNNAETRETNTSNYNSIKAPKMISHFNKTMPKDSIKIKCSKCSNFINKGEIVYHCESDEFFIHSTCFLKNANEQNIKVCSKCNSDLTLGIYELNQPNNTLSTGLRYKARNMINNQGHKTNNTSKKSSFIMNERAGSINSNMASTNEGDETNEKSRVCMDTNINGLDDYDKLCENALDIPLESMIEILNEKENNNIPKMEEFNNNINSNNGLNIRSTLINKNNNNNKAYNRVALSPLTILNTPYICNKRKGLSLLTTINTNQNNKQNKNISLNFNNNMNLNINKVQRKLNFLSDTKNEDININAINNNINSPRNSILNTNNSQYSNNSLRNLDFNDITNEEINEEENDEDKENSPPLLKENTRFIQNEDNNNDENNNNENESPNNNKGNLEINISGGISHITSDIKKTVEIPITLEINTINSNIVNYSKETLLIFNTNSLNLEQVLLILRIFSEKMNEDDKIYSNIFKSVQGLGKKQINDIINIKNNNYFDVFKETERINYEKISTLIEYAIDLSMNSFCNIFSVLLINDIDEINCVNGDYSLEIKKIIKKLEISKVNLLKYFSINAIILDDRGTTINPKNKNEKNINFISYLYDLTMMCMGFFYSPKNLEELTKSVYLYCCNLEQFSLLNVKLIIKGNQDPSVYLEALNYPINKINHNDFEIIIGPLLKKEKKIINLVATIILNNPDINILLPLMDVSCEYLSKKNEIYTNNNNLVSVNDNIFKERTDYYRLNIPILRQKKKIKISYSVMLRNIISKTAQRISRSIDYFKKFDYENALITIYEANDLYERFWKSQKEFLKRLQIIFDKNNANNSLLFTNLNMSFNNVNLSILDNSSFDMNNSNNASNIIDGKNNNSLKIMNFINAVSNDLNLCINIIKMRKLNQICQLLSIQQSLSFYRVVIFDDNRFLEDNYLNMN